MFWNRRGPTLEQFKELEAEVKAIRREWLDTEEKLRRLYDRTRKRQEREDGPEASDDLQARKSALRVRAFSRGA